MNAKRRQHQKQERKQRKSPVSWAEASRDIVITTIERGVILPMFLSAALLLILWRLDSDQYVDIVTNVSVNYGWMGWSLCIVLTILYAIHARRQRRFHSDEYRRIGTEKSTLQNQLGNSKFDSSNQ